MNNKVKKLVGKIISDKMNKTVVVSVDRKVKHPIYGKFIKRSTRYHVHDDHNICKQGDTVSIAETRPYSKMKKWRLIQVIKKAQ